MKEPRSAGAFNDMADRLAFSLRETAGRIKARQINGRWRIPVSAIEDTRKRKRSRANGAT